jgi:hypothetical protein
MDPVKFQESFKGVIKHAYNLNILDLNCYCCFGENANGNDDLFRVKKIHNEYELLILEEYEFEYSTLCI